MPPLPILFALLTLLAPLLLLPRPRLAAGLTAVLATGTAILSAQRAASWVVPWLQHNGQTLVEVGLRPTPFGAAALAVLALAAALDHDRLWRPQALCGAGIALLAPDLVQGLVGLSLVGLLAAPLPALREPDAVQAWSARRLGDALALLGLAALHQHTAEFGLRAPILPDSPQSTLIAGLLVAAASVSTGVLPWPAPRRADGLAAGVGLALLWQMQSLIRVAPAVGTVLALLAVLSLARLGLARAPLWSVWPALVVLVLAQGKLALAALGVLVWPLLLVASPGVTVAAVLLPGCLLAGEALSTFADQARWLPLGLLVVGLVGLGAARPALDRPRTLHDGIAVLAGLIGVTGLTALAQILAVPMDGPPLWAPPLAGLLVVTGAALAPSFPILAPPSLWGLSWREGLRPVTTWLGR